MTKERFKRLHSIKFMLACVITMMLLISGTVQTVYANTDEETGNTESAENQSVIKEIQITGINKPVGGKISTDEMYQNVEIPKEASYIVDEIVWHDKEGNAVPDSGFVCGKEYLCVVVLKPVEGYYFNADESLMVTINEKNADSYEIVSGNVEVEMSFTALCGEKWDDGTITKAADCTKTGVMTYTCTVCGKTKTETIKKKSHSYSKTYTTDKKARQSAPGSKSKHCTRKGCTAKSSVTVIPKIDSQKLSYTTEVYNGKAKKAPTLTIKDSEDNKLTKGTDYSVKGLSSETKVGRYKVEITYKGKYDGSKTLWFTIVPKKPSSASAKLSDISKVGGYDDITFSWKSSTGAKGYLVYYKKASASKWSEPVSTTKTSYTKKDLSDGVKYTFKVLPYYKTSSGTTKYYKDDQYTTASVTTKNPGRIITKKSFKYYEYYKGGYSDGKYAKNAFVTLDKKTYYFDKNGKMVTGWMKKSDVYYYFDRSTGVQKKNCTIDGIKIKSSGKATATTLNKKKMDLMITARKKMQEVTKPTDTKEQKLKKVFKWVMPYPYHRYRILPLAKQSKGWEVVFANDIFENKKGCCVSESCAFAFLAKECGYETVYVADDTEHAWVEIDGRVYDTLFATSKSFDTYYNGTYKKAKLYCHSKSEI